MGQNKDRRSSFAAKAGRRLIQELDSNRAFSVVPYIEAHVWTRGFRGGWPRYRVLQVLIIAGGRVASSRPFVVWD